MAETTSAPSLRDWVLVPREPTEAMLEAGAHGSGEDSEAVAAGAWSAMLAAAPTPPTTLSEAVASARAEGVREGLETARRPPTARTSN